MSALTEKIIIKKISNLIVPYKETGKNKNFFIILDEKEKTEDSIDKLLNF